MARPHAFEDRRAGWRGRLPEIALACAVASVAALLVAPIPAFGLDVLLATNLALAVVVLLVALAVQRPLAVSSFPAILLLATLFRLGLNVSSTRLILRDAWAGDVISTFASWVIGGSLIVGVVIFLIVSVIQFVVIARGSERVAEVAARFALDAMPGRQMAIDADLRAGSLTAPQASAARDRLQREGRLYGAMDGAMKFVKGDAIAGLFILGVDIVGGVTVGVLERGLDFRTALQTYGTLTIGDGLVTQIPSLLVAMGAAFVVTRVASVSEHGDASWLGRDIVDQIGSQSRALAVAAVFVAVLGLLPGLPIVPFLALAALLGLAAWLGARRLAAAEPVDAVETPAAALPPRLSLSLATAHPLAAHSDAELRTAISAVATRVGLPIPRPDIGRDAAESGLFFDGHRVRTLPEDAAVDALQHTIETALPSLVSMSDVQRTLDGWAEREPELVRALVPAHASLFAVTALIRALLEQGVRPTPLRPVLEAILAGPADGEGDREAVLATRRTAARLALAPHIVRDALGAPQRPVVVVGRSIETLLADQIRRTPARPALAPTLQQDIRRALEETITVHDADLDLRAVVLAVGQSARPALALLAAALAPGAPVLSIEELAAAETAGVLAETVLDADVGKV